MLSSSSSSSIGGWCDQKHKHRESSAGACAAISREGWQKPLGLYYYCNCCLQASRRWAFVGADEKK